MNDRERALEIRRRFEHFEKHNNISTPEVMLIWCRQARNHQDPMCQAIARQLVEILASRAVQRHLYSGDEEVDLDALESARSVVRSVTHGAIMRGEE